MKLRIPRKKKKAYKKMMAKWLEIEPKKLKYIFINRNIIIEYEQQERH